MTRTEAIYELHITADNSNAAQAALFMQECKQAGVKAFFVDNGINKVSTHLMTSVICKGGDALAQAQKTIQFASARSGAQITRTKVEVPPGPGFDYVAGSMYYEVHVEVKGEHACDIPFDHHLWSCSARPDKPGFFPFDDACLQYHARSVQGLF